MPTPIWAEKIPQAAQLRRRNGSPYVQDGFARLPGEV